MIKTLAVTVGALLSSCVPNLNCAPPTSAPAPEPAPTVDCDEKISWNGRSPVDVIREWENPQHFLDAGNAVNIGVDGAAHVAGHYSSHGSIFRAASNLGVGDAINYDCDTYHVYGRGSGAVGEVIDFRGGLTVQYSGCSGVCLVFAE